MFYLLIRETRALISCSWKLTIDKIIINVKLCKTIDAVINFNKYTKTYNKKTII